MSRTAAQPRQAPRTVFVPALAALVLATLVVVGVLIWVRHDLPPGQGHDPGQPAAEQYIRDYVSALNANQAVELGRLLDKPSGSFEVQERLRRYGGRGLGAVRVSMRTDFPRVYQVSITAQAADGSTVRMREVIEWATGRWHMAPVAAPSPS